MFKINILNKCINIFFTVWMFFLSVSATEARMNLFNIGHEKQISAPDMDCNYRIEDHWKSTYNFEYPKIVTINNGSPLIAFVDEKSENIFLTEISSQDIKILYNQPSHDLNSWRRWPIIFANENKIYFALFSDDVSVLSRRVKMYLFDRGNKKLNLEEDKIFKIEGRCNLWGIYPYHTDFMLIGRCNYIALRYIPTLLLGGLPEFHHNASFILNSNKDSGEKLTRQSIEEQGCYKVFNQVYDVSTTGSIQAAWVRNTTTLGLKHDETIYLSTNKDGVQWSPPIELYSVKNTEIINQQINNLSLASYGNSSFLLWQDREKGIFFSELKNGNKIELTPISDMKEIDSIQPMAVASTIKVTADNDGNAYVLWIKNTGSGYKLYFKARINGQWTPELIINEGPYSVKLPDMKVDKEGRVHITYIKSINPNKPSGKYGSFYMMLERQDKGK
ncbi:hypothetical protein DS62_10360 [Smithella sp. SC_K08D17]|nr:hypothetical protein KD27_02920 [Smithella sp. D17]KIE18479.1 hypothetical protein DS62_10360 [Smithella sp. SC_K08D17]